MSRSRLHSRLIVPVLLAAVAACSDDEPPTMSSGDALTADVDVATATGAAIASDVAVWAGSEAAVAAGFAGAGAPPAGNCSRTGSTTTCTDGREGTLTVRRTVEFFDAAGAAQAQYDAATTASIDIGVRARGTVSGPRYTSSVVRSSELTISGLAGAETQRTWNGSGAAAVQSTFTGEQVTREHQMTESDTTTDVVWTVSPRAPWPASGTVVHRIALRTRLSGARTGTFAGARRVQVTFNGTSRVPMEVQSVARGGTRVVLSCQLDLEARTVTCPRPEQAR
jgi:hypothetical protein